MFKSLIFKICLVTLISITVQTGFAQSFETVMRKTYALLTIAQERDRQAAESLDEIKSRRIRAEEDFVDLQEHNKISKKDREKAETQIKLLKKQEAETQKKRREATLFLNEVTDLIKASDKKRAKYIADYEKTNGLLEKEESSIPTEVIVNTPSVNKPTTNEILEKASEPTYAETSEPTHTTKHPEDNVSGTVVNPEPVVIDKKSKKGKSESKKSSKKESYKEPKKESKKIAEKESKKPSKNAPVITKQMAKYNAQADVALNPPMPDCVLAFDGIDNFTQRKRRETSSQVLFRHTEDFMKATMNGKDYINCEVTASRVQGGFYYINLTFTILTKEAQKSFGFLDKGTAFVFKTVSGRIVTLSNSKTDIGQVDNNKNATIYRAQLQMNSSDAKTLSESELDIFRVAWSAGYEDYEIYNMDVLQNTLKCLDKEAK